MVGAVWITSATIIAERFGSKIGGVITGIPSTIVIALFFIAWTQTPFVASESTGIIPVVMGLDALFTAMYIMLSHYKLYLSIGISLLVWFVLSLSLVLVKFNDFFLSLLGFGILMILSYFIGEKLVKVKSQGKRAMKFTFQQILFRALLSGTIIAFAVLMTKIGGPIVGGVFATFPAVMLSTMIITYIAHGREFSVAVMKVLMVSGGISVVVYASAVRFLYPSFGIIYGTFFSFLISLVSSYLMYFFVSKKMT